MSCPVMSLELLAAADTCVVAVSTTDKSQRYPSVPDLKVGAYRSYLQHSRPVQRVADTRDNLAVFQQEIAVLERACAGGLSCDVWHFWCTKASCIHLLNVPLTSHLAHCRAASALRTSPYHWSFFRSLDRACSSPISLWLQYRLLSGFLAIRSTRRERGSMRPSIRIVGQHQR